MRDTGWSGRLRIGRDWWCFEGVNGDARAHAHLCAQVAVGLDGPARVEIESGVVEAPVVAIAPGVRHKLLASSGSLRVIYPRPLGRLARRWGIRDWRSATAAPADWAPLLTADPLEATLDAEADLGRAQQIDPRLRAVLDDLGDEADLADLAKRAGLSPARLRALAQAELGAPLAHWRLWLRLEMALLRLRAGESLAAAATEAGFVDQSHLNRTMRRFFGVTPLTVAKLMDGLLR